MGSIFSYFYAENVRRLDTRPFYREENLLLLLSQGDEQAFTLVYQQTYAGLYYFVKRYVGEEEARDIVAETYVKLLRSPRQFQNFAHFNTYMRTAARNACIDLLHRESRENKEQELLSYLMAEIQDDDYNQRAELESLLYKKVLDEIEKLPPFTRKIFTMSFIDGLDNAQIGQLLGIKDQTVRNKKAEALKLIRIRLKGIFPLLYFCKFFSGF